MKGRKWVIYQRETLGLLFLSHVLSCHVMRPQEAFTEGPLHLGLLSLQNHEPNELLLLVIYSFCDILL
jgi:hypothetical protein